MNLSEAILLGAQKKPQNFGCFHEDGRTCVLAAAAEGLTGQPAEKIEGQDEGFAGVLCSAFPELMLRRVLCPLDCGQGRIRVWDILHHLNDAHRWTRERIAGWVATLEGDAARRT